MVGGRPGQVGSSRTFVERLDGTLLHHGGGIDDNINRRRDW
jgi:hypothetical protein